MALFAHIDIRSGRLRLSLPSLLPPTFRAGDINENADADFEEEEGGRGGGTSCRCMAGSHFVGGDILEEANAVATE